MCTLEGKLVHLTEELCGLLEWCYKIALFLDNFVLSE